MQHLVNKSLDSNISIKPHIFGGLIKIDSSFKVLTSTIMLISLTGCGSSGGSGSGYIPVLPEDNTPTVIYVDGDPLVPVTYAPLGSSSIAGTFKQQTVINAKAAWDEGYKGQGITIGAVDTGVNPNHIEFYKDDGTSRVNYQDAGGIEYDATNDQLIYSDNYIDTDTDYHHGTHVASIALGREYGIAPEATLLPINVFQNNENTYNIAVIAAVDYLADKTPIINASITDMVNFSTQGGTNSELNSYKTILENNDTALVVAAGNGGIDDIGDPIGAEHFINNNTAQNLAIQSGIENQVLSAIALNDNGSISSFSDYPGSCSDVTNSSDIACDNTVMTAIQNTFISVPGVSIKAADGSTTTETVSYSGTSMAAPIVSGSLAVLLSSWDQLTIQQAVDILKSTANNSGIYAQPETYGVGLLDLQAALTPVGNLKSTASTQQTQQTQQSYTLNESTLKVPASLSGLANLSALKSVAYFDNYNRDFLVDITPAIQIEKTPIGWNRFWEQSQSYPTNQITLGNYQITMAFSNLMINNSVSSDLQQVTIENAQNRFDFKQHSPADLIQTQLNPLMSHFYSNNQDDFGHTLSMQQNLGANLAFFSAMQEQDKTFNRVINNQNKLLTQVQTIGLRYQPNSNWSFALSSQLRQEQDGLMGLQGSGAFSFGESNRSQINTAAVQYSHNGIHLYSQLQQGQLLNSKQASGSYIQVNKAQMGQLKFGLMQQISEQSAWGLQTYNYNSLLKSDISLTLPVGMSSTGEVENQTIRYSQKNSLQPDTVELFYKTSFENTLQYQLNVINSPDDSGIGLKFNQRF